ncbi:unnamed protein product [Ixodes pacificus]
MARGICRHDRRDSRCSLHRRRRVPFRLPGWGPHRQGMAVSIHPVCQGFIIILGVRHMHTTAYHLSASGMVERLRRQLKAALTTPREHWDDYLPLVLLGRRSALEADIGCPAAVLVYGVPLRLPGQFFFSPSTESKEGAIGYVDDLRRTFRLLRPVLPPKRSHRHIFVCQDLESSRMFSFDATRSVDHWYRPTVYCFVYFIAKPRRSHWTSTAVMR